MVLVVKVLSFGEDLGEAKPMLIINTISGHTTYPELTLILLLLYARFILLNLQFRYACYQCRIIFDSDIFFFSF